MSRGVSPPAGQGGSDVNIVEEFLEECSEGLKDGFSINSQLFDIIVKEILKDNPRFIFDVNVFTVSSTEFVSPPPSHFIKPFFHSNHFVLLHFFENICYIYDSLPNYCTEEREKCIRKLVKEKEKEIRIIDTGPQGNNDCAFYAISSLASLVGFPLPDFPNSLSRRRFFIEIAKRKTFEDDPFLANTTNQDPVSESNLKRTKFFQPKDKEKRTQKPKIHKQKSVTKREMKAICNAMKLGSLIKVEFFKEDKETWVGILMKKDKSIEVFFLYELCISCDAFKQLEQEITLPLPLPFPAFYFSVAPLPHLSLCNCDDNEFNLLDMEEIEKEIRKKNQDTTPNRFFEEKEQIKTNKCLSLFRSPSSLNGNGLFFLVAPLTYIN